MNKTETRILKEALGHTHSRTGRIPNKGGVPILGNRECAAAENLAEIGVIEFRESEPLCTNGTRRGWIMPHRLMRDEMRD